MRKITLIIGILLVAGTDFVFAQEDCNPNPPQNLQPIAAYSIYRGEYRNDNFQFALNFSRWMTCAKPKTMEGNPRFSLPSEYERIIRIYTEIGKTQQDPSVKEAYVDSALALFNESFEIFTDEEVSKFDLHQKRGRYLLENYQMIDGGLGKAYDDFAAMFELDPQRATELGSGYYVRVTVDNMARTGQKEAAISMIEAATEFANDDLLSFFDSTLQDLFDSPEEKVTFYKGKLEANPEDLESLKGLADAYDDLNQMADRVAVLRKIHGIEPTFASALTLAEVEQGSAEYNEALTYYKEALEKAPSDTEKKEINLDIADVYTSLGQLQNAKTYISAAIKIDPNYGLAYIKMSGIYAQAIINCTADRKIEPKDKVVYWVVVDYLNKAKQVDNSVTRTVNSQLASFEAVTPTTEERFLTLNYEVGQTVKVDGSLMACYSWINETTTVR